MHCVTVASTFLFQKYMEPRSVVEGVIGLIRRGGGGKRVAEVGAGGA